jgi:hypothetical protein
MVMVIIIVIVATCGTILTSVGVLHVEILGNAFDAGVFCLKKRAV